MAGAPDRRREGDAEIVAIGNELLLGETVDTNSAHVARRLAEAGVRVRRTTHVGDDRSRLAAVLREARGRSRWVITMGGLGPTRDDLTREVVAEVLGRPLEIDEALLEEVEEKFRRSGYAGMPAANRSQAQVPAGARVIPNPHGTAPGLIVEDGSTTFFVLPGVPREMMDLLEEGVLPELVRGRSDGGGAPVVRSRTVRTAGIGESSLAELLDDLVARADPVEVAFLPHLGRVDVRLTIAGSEPEEAEHQLDALAREIATRAERWSYGFDGVTLAGAIGDALRARGWTVAAAESCTAGELTAALTEVPGASDYFVGGIVAYANHVKETALGVPRALLEAHGAVSEEVCRAMIEGVRERLGATLGCAITGIAGPGGGTAEKPVGLVYCGVGSSGEARVRRLHAPGGRAEVRSRATFATLALLLDLARGTAP